MSTTQEAEDAKQDAVEPRTHWVSRLAFPVISAMLAVSLLALGLAVKNDYMWLAFPLMLLVSHLMHGQLIGFHEASHGLLRKNRRLNEVDGLLIGIFSLMSFSLYRAAHQTHHMRLGTERDEELWPFVQPGIPRWQRISAACVELTAGLLFTPFLFLRTFLRAGSPIRSRKVRRRIWLEVALLAAVWAAMLIAVQMLGLWKYFLWMYLVPAMIAGNLQSWRKYIEHVGLTGSTIRSATRSIIAEDWFGKVVSFTLLHEPFHGVHHQRAGLPHSELPNHAVDLIPCEADETAPFPSYTRALAHLLKTLSDPKVGRQWHRASTEARAAQ